MFGRRRTEKVPKEPRGGLVSRDAVVLATVTVLVVLIVGVGTAGAQTPITGCMDADTDAFIDSSGAYELQNDVSNDSTCVEIVADDVVFDGGGNNITAVGSPGESAVVVENADNVTVTNFAADGWDGGNGGAVRLFDVSGSEVSDVRSANSRVPFRINSSSDTVVRNNTVKGSTDIGIYLLDSSTDVTVEDNDVRNSGAQSLRIESGSDGTTVLDNVFESNGGGVSSVDVISDGNVLYNNTVFDNDDNGFFVEGDDNVIRDNNVTLTQTAGIWLRPPSFNTTVEGNRVADTGNDGIRMDSSENTVVGNEVTGAGSGNTGIAITDGTATSNLIAENTVFDNYQGMFVEGTDHIIQDNVVTGSNGGTDGNGIRITSAASGVTVDDNAFSNNDNDGVKIEDSSGHTVTDNTANGNGASGVATVGSSSSNTIENNAADGNRDGIFVEGNDNTVLSNTAENNDDAGIDIRFGASDTTVVENTVRGNTVDFRLEGSVDNTVESLTVGASATDATVDFDAKDVELDGVASPPADPSNKQNVGSYVEATGTASDSFLNLSFRYEATGVVETTLSVWKYDGSWTELPSELDTGANTVSADISSFSVFAPLGNSACVDRRSLSRGQEERECPTDREISRGGSREELDRSTGRNSDTARRDRGRGEGRGRDRGRSR